MTSQHLRIAGENINLPFSASTPPKTRDALERAVAGKAETREARDRLGRAQRDLERATAEWPKRRARAIADRVDPGENPVPAAEAAVAAAVDDLKAHESAEVILSSRLRDAIENDREAWTARAQADAAEALAALTEAAKTIRRASEALNDNLGVLGMYKRLGETGRLSVWRAPEGSHFDLNAAVLALGEGLSKAEYEVGRLGPREGKKGKKAKGGEES
jgi:hypothetical protein